MPETLNTHKGHNVPCIRTSWTTRFGSGDAVNLAVTTGWEGERYPGLAAEHVHQWHALPTRCQHINLCQASLESGLVVNSKQPGASAVVVLGVG